MRNHQVHWNLLCLQLEVRAADTFLPRPVCGPGDSLPSCRCALEELQHFRSLFFTGQRPAASFICGSSCYLFPRAAPPPPSPHDPIPSVRDDLHSGARGACLRSPAAHLSRGGGSLCKVGGGAGGFPRGGRRTMEGSC